LLHNNVWEVDLMMPMLLKTELRDGESRVLLGSGTFND
jgi:hypothetical protein